MKYPSYIKRYYQYLEKLTMSALEFINTAWPVAVGFVTLVIVLAKMHNDIETLKEKVKVMFDLWNNRK